MSGRRILSLWFPRLGAERALRAIGAAPELALATVAASGNAQVLASLSAGAEAAGLRPGQALRDAGAICPTLVSRPQDPPGEAATLSALARWAGRLSPWVAEDPPEALMLDITGCAHLFGGEAALMARAEADCAGLGLTLRAGLADTVGAAWALARFAGRDAGQVRSGDAIEQEARATRARAARRVPGGDRGGDRGFDTAPGQPAGAVAPPGRTRAALDPLPVAALRLPPEAVETLGRLGLRRIGDLAGQPRAALARRFGQTLVARLDQALGVAPEPVSPAAPAPRLALRLSLPDPVGRESDLLAAIDRLLPALCARLADAGRGARTVRLQAFRCDRRTETLEVSLARPAAEPARIRPLLAMKIADLDAGPGIDALRLAVAASEPVHAVQHKGHLEAAGAAARHGAPEAALDDLIGRLGARVGLDAITRPHPADSHIPEKTAQVLAAAWSAPAGAWPAPPTPRPALIWPPEPVHPAAAGTPPRRFRWRGRTHAVAAARGPERIAPEWWLDDPAWRTGVRDYWVVTTAAGERLWLFNAHGAGLPGGWLCHGAFA